MKIVLRRPFGLFEGRHCLLLHIKKFRISLILSSIISIVFFYSMYHVPVKTANTVHEDILKNGAFDGERYMNPNEIVDEMTLQLTRSSSENSVFYKISESYTTQKWQKLSKFDQCKILIDTIVDDKDNWSHWSHESIDTDESLVQMVERLRIYNHCFLNEKVALNDMFSNNEEQMLQFIHQIFPIFQLNFEDDNSNTITIHSLQKDKTINIPFHKSTKNIFHNWLESSNGKGIITTMAPDEVDIFIRLVKILDKLENKIPVQIIVTNTDDMNNIRTQLCNKIENTKQDIQIIDCSNVLNESFVTQKVTGYLNKWIATIFNTFDEFIFIDVDSIPFKPPSEFFKISNYKKHNMHMYRDRNLGYILLEKRCKRSFANLEPSNIEYDLIGTKWKYTLKSSTLNPANDNTIEEAIYDDFFNRLQLHQVDSGLVIIKKNKETFGSLLMSFLLNTADVTNDCIHGDKEYFWLGPLISGIDYSIDSFKPGAIGGLYESIVNDNTKKIGVCSTQIGHYNNQNEILWINGGLKNCKNPNAAKNDFSVYQEFTTVRYENINKLQAIYDSALYIDGIVIPDQNEDGWVQTRECAQFRFCATVDVYNSNNKPISGQYIHFTERQVQLYKEFSEIWSHTETK